MSITEPNGPRTSVGGLGRGAGLATAVFLVMGAGAAADGAGHTPVSLAAATVLIALVLVTYGFHLSRRAGIALVAAAAALALAVSAPSTLRQIPPRPEAMVGQAIMGLAVLYLFAEKRDGLSASVVVGGALLLSAALPLLSMA